MKKTDTDCIVSMSRDISQGTDVCWTCRQSCKQKWSGKQWESAGQTLRQLLSNLLGKRVYLVACRPDACSVCDLTLLLCVALIHHHRSRLDFPHLRPTRTERVNYRRAMKPAFLRAALSFHLIRQDITCLPSLIDLK